VEINVLADPERLKSLEPPDRLNRAAAGAKRGRSRVKVPSGTVSPHTIRST
jgi:hypothetical protein